MDWKERLYKFEVIPPGKVWERIANDLDNEFLGIRNRLTRLEEQPPAGVWNRVREELAEKQKGPIPVPAGPNRKRILQTAMAAVVVGLVFMGVKYGWFRPSLTENRIVQETHIPAAKDSSPATVSPDSGLSEKISTSIGGMSKIISNFVHSKQQGSVVHEQPAVLGEAENGSGRIQTDNPVPLPVTDQVASLSDQFDLNSLNKKLRNLEGQINDDVNLRELASGYLVLSDTNNEDVRLSSKLRNLRTCLVPNAAKEEILNMILGGNGHCNTIVRQWQEKILTSAFIPSLQNFMGIEDLTKLLQSEHE
jgi:hypothetical protein